MASSDALTPDASAPRRLGRFLTGTEAKEIADRLSDGDTLTAALRTVQSGRRSQVRELLSACGLGTLNAATAISTLRAVEGSRSSVTAMDPWWTMPGHVAMSGALTPSIERVVDGARQSVTCSTFNFMRSSVLWSALARASSRPEMTVRVYVDGNAADATPSQSVPTTRQVAAHLHPALVWRSKYYDGSYVRNHAKFLVVDHRFLLVTSANFSWSAEQGNVEFGVFIDNGGLAESVEREVRSAEGALYERV